MRASWSDVLGRLLCQECVDAKNTIRVKKKKYYPNPNLEWNLAKVNRHCDSAVTPPLSWLGSRSKLCDSIRLGPSEIMYRFGSRVVHASWVKDRCACFWRLLMVETPRIDESSVFGRTIGWARTDQHPNRSGFQHHGHECNRPRVCDPKGVYGLSGDRTD